MGIVVCLISCSNTEKKSLSVKEIVKSESKAVISKTKLSPVLLIAPKNQWVSTEDKTISKVKNNVTFVWKAPDNTITHEIILRNLRTGRVINKRTSKETLTLSLFTDTPYEWFVVSKTKNKEHTSSKKWQFYTHKKVNKNRAPEKAMAEFPEDKAIVDYWNQTPELRWAANDADDDIVSYEIYFGKDKLPTKPTIITTNTKYNFDADTIVFGSKFFWQIKTIDSKGNTSVSKVYSFTLMCSKCQ
ncbi:hypothetical protein [Wenyingzhuangia sp. IMCC45574]